MVNGVSTINLATSILKEIELCAVIAPSIRFAEETLLKADALPV